MKKKWLIDSCKYELIKTRFCEQKKYHEEGEEQKKKEYKSINASVISFASIILNKFG